MNARIALTLLAATCLAGVSGCAPTRMLKTPLAGETTSIGVFEDGAVALRVDGMIFRDGPNSWARKAYWDEYMVTIRNRGSEPVRVEGLSIIDPMGAEVAATSDRRSLARNTKQNLRRYQESGLRVKPGASPVGFVAGGGAMVAGGTAVAGSAAATGLLGSGGSAAILAAGAAAVIGGVAVIGAGVDRAIENGRIQESINTRSLHAVDLSPADTAAGSAFFPLVPAPQKLVLHYRDAAGERQTLSVDLAALNQLHLSRTN